MEQKKMSIMDRAKKFYKDHETACVLTVDVIAVGGMVYLTYVLGYSRGKNSKYAAELVKSVWNNAHETIEASGEEGVVRNVWKRLPDGTLISDGKVRYFAQKVE